ncbi:methyltransferase-like protein [Coniella lustricola]|uniref:tRNA wybutosine-synthesizing protein 4 n=1 Tax=Coniella lustricola TaxID=2025994 RepID=A0A2T2ZXR1_9PEZI|nr:methyltransferase-like protein [Coniella lustricola]
MGPRKRQERGSEQHADSGLGAAKGEDMLVMATNNSSIVSKRSVERLYYPDEPHFFRFFVNKHQRRAPLINRGYHLRLHVIDVTLRNFLSQPSSRPKVVVNLGCGSDVIPWQCWTRYPQDCSNSRAIFVDVDFPHLIQRKRQVVLNTPELVSQLPQLDAQPTKPNLFLASHHYYQVGCDLRQIATLEAALASIVDVSECVFLFVAEVSITYMETETADSVVDWAAKLGQAEFCLLEQILPDGPDHPFATTMTSHFDKLSTPIKSVTTYPTIAQQRTRFQDRGWPNVDAQSLWSAWNDDKFFTVESRQRLDLVEPFDEWEEFALFGAHYVLLHAKNTGEDSFSAHADVAHTAIRTEEVDVKFERPTGQNGLRRFGGAMTTTSALGNEFIVNCLGLGRSTRLPSYDVYTRKDTPMGLQMDTLGGPTSRMCFTLTDLGCRGFLLTGGRTSPAKAMGDCWLFTPNTQKWEPTYDLPIPLFRHSACRLGNSSLALVYGGKSGASEISDAIMVYHPQRGWLNCQSRGALQPEHVFGATLICSGRSQTSASCADFHGFLMGGLSAGGMRTSQIMAWNLSAPIIIFSSVDNLGSETVNLLSRFGASHVQQGEDLILVGGIGHNGFFSRKDDIALFSRSGSSIKEVSRLLMPASSAPRPLLVGSSVVSTRDGDIVIIGGAATCFSMGTFWTPGAYTLRRPTQVVVNVERPILGWEFSQSGELVQTSQGNVQQMDNNSNQPVEIRAVQRTSIDSRESFAKIMEQGLPVILEGLDLGSCLSKWTLDYLTKAIGETRKVVVHEAQSKKMDFTAKNFRYTTMGFGNFAKRVLKGDRLYLRALSQDAPADRAASLEQDFPSLAADFVIPDHLHICQDNIHSSILRVSGAVNMWLHYVPDVQANIYCQISGSKRMVLFPPADVSHLAFAPGASSSSLDIFGSQASPILRNCHPLEAILNPGDVLYLPPLWLHTAEPVMGQSIAVNVFFRSLRPDSYGTGRDVYGNQDLAAYDKGRKDVNKIATAFTKVPLTYKQFYLLRLAQELAEKARDPGP